MAGQSKEYKMAIRIAGEIDKSLPAAAKLSKSELRAIVRDAAIASQEIGGGFKSSLADTRAGLESVNKVGSAAFKAVKASAKIAATAVGAITAASVKTGMDFEAQMSTVKAISGAADSDFEKLTTKAEYMGATTAFTAKEAGEAMEYMSMAGWKTNEMLAGTEGIMDLAAASGENLGTTSDIVTDALTAFGLQAKDSAHFADVLAKASSSSNTNVGMMGETFKYVGATAGGLKYTAEDVATSIGLMANSGIKASMAGTQTRRLMAETAGGITLSAKAFAKAGKETGKLKISTANADGTMKPWSETVDKLREAFSKMTDQEKTANAEAIGGKTAMTGLLAIVNASEKDYKKLTNEINNADGAAKEMAKTRLDNLQGDITLFTSAMQGARIEIYDEIKEPLRDVVQSATKWVGEFSENFATEFPTVVREVKQAGEALGDFAEPFLDVGEWLLDNPDVLAGTITGVGTALATYKVAAGIMSLAESLSSLSSGSKYILALGAVVGVISGIGAEIEASSRKAASASLDRNFGDIALSMDEIQTVSAEIVGAKKLESVSELLSSMKVSENLIKDIEQARKSIDKIGWKTSVGLKISESDLSEYESDVKKYVNYAQDLISEKGYEIQVATNLLFGEDSQKILTENNSFYAGLDKEATELSDKVNKKLKKAMKDGLSVDLEEEINGLLDQLSDITTAIDNAEAESSWEILQADWSGTDLSPDSFKNLQSQINENITEIEEGARNSYKEYSKNLLAQRNMGYITEEEYTNKKKEAETAYNSSKLEAREKGIEFEYNTLMDTYGKEIASGQFNDGDKEAIEQIISGMQESAQGTKYEDNLRTIYLALQQNTLTDLDNWLTSTFNGKQGVYSKWDQESKGLAQDYLNKKEEKFVKDSLAGLPEETQDVFNTNPMDFNNMLLIPAQKSSKNASDAIKTTIQSEMSTGVTASLPINLTGTYSVTKPNTSLFPTFGGSLVSSTSQKGKSPKMYGKGGLATSPQEAIVAEAGVWEMMIPIERTENSFRLWKQTGELLGIKSSPNSFSNLSKAMESAEGSSLAMNQSTSSPMEITYSPRIVIQGSANKEDVTTAINDSYSEFEKMMNRYMRKNGRVSFG